MVTPLAWDSAFFGRRMGVLAGDRVSAEGVARALAAAAADGYEYLLCRLPAGDAGAIRALERAGFYLVDVGVTWGTDPARYLEGADSIGTETTRLAVEADLNWLQRDAVRLFRQSRFYHDPFFSTADADRLHAAWIANSVRGEAADAVWVVPDEGFVTCKIARDGTGHVVLIGVREEAQGRGVGRRLMTAAVRWFAAAGASRVLVKTQVKNLGAMNFYRRLGFDLHASDLTLACVLSRAPEGAEQGAAGPGSIREERAFEAGEARPARARHEHAG